MCNMMKNPYRIGRGPGYQRASDVAGQGTCGNYATAGLSKNKRRKASKEAAAGGGTVIKVEQ